MSKRIVSAILCLALVVAMAVPALAATTLYSRPTLATGSPVPPLFPPAGPPLR